MYIQYLTYVFQLCTYNASLINIAEKDFRLHIVHICVHLDRIKDRSF